MSLAARVPPPRYLLGQALHAEWTKLRTVAGPAWLLAGVITLTVAVGAAAASADPVPVSHVRDRPRHGQLHRGSPREARDIARRPPCQLRLDRAAVLAPAGPAVRAGKAP